ncbi:hypothetical protein HC891_21205, partial [Candidatus Gracilibacteria bacterium]|nr:hypothetical protein [Candidatus Gracilibacteria bacterium]
MANVGTITFPRPGDGPYELRFPTYETLSFALDTPLAAAGSVIDEGSFTIEQSLKSGESALRDISLDVTDMTIEADQISFAIAFTNNGSQGYDLLVGPSGSDARLLDAEGVQYEPTDVSATLAEGIAPAGGWLPKQANTGTLTFERPAALNELRLTFPSYDALTIRLDERGLASAEVTSATGGAPQPTPTLDAEELALNELRSFIEAQSAALASGDREA